MKKLLQKLVITLSTLLFLSSFAMAQNSTTVSTTGVVDTDSFTWSYGTWNATFTPAPGVNPNSYVWTGGALQQVYSGSLSSTGTFSASLPSSTAINPLGSTWTFTITPNASRGAFTVPISVTGSTQDLTSALNAAAVGPRFPYSNVNFGYGVIELSTSVPNGAIFFNTTSDTPEYCTITSSPSCTWTVFSTGGGSGTVNPCSTQYALAAYLATGTTVGCVPNIQTDAAGDLLAAVMATKNYPVVDASNPAYGCFPGALTGACITTASVEAAAIDGILYIPNQGTPIPAVVPIVLSVASNGDLFVHIDGYVQASTTMANVFNTPVGSKVINGLIWGAGTIDGQELANDGLYLQYASTASIGSGRIKVADIRVINQLVNGFHCGAQAAAGKSECAFIDVSTDRPDGVAAPTGSIGILFDNAQDSQVSAFGGGDGIVGNQTGVSILSGDDHIRVMGVHAWVHSSSTMVQCFNDGGNFNMWELNYCDTPATYGFYITGFPTDISSNIFYQTTFHADDTVYGVYAVNGFYGSFTNNQFQAASGHRWKQDINFGSGYVTGAVAIFSNYESTYVVTQTPPQVQNIAFTNYADFTGYASAPANPASGSCRQYFNTTTGVMSWVNSSGASCSAATPTLYYQTVKDNGTSQTQEPALNLIPAGNTTIVCADNSGVSTNCTINTGANGGLTGTTGSIGGSLLTAGACATGTASVTGVTYVSGGPNPAVSASANTSGAPNNTLNFSVSAQVTAANTITVSVCAPAAGTPTASTYNVYVGPGLTVSGSTGVVASANSSIASGSNGTVVTVDGFGNLNGTATLLSGLAPLASPALSGTPTAPTPSAGNSSNTLATTNFVQTALGTTWYISPFFGTSSVAFVNIANRVTAYGFIPNANVTFGAIVVISHTVDASDLYSVAIANSSGTLICHPTTGQAVPAFTALMTNTCSEGTVTLTAGSVYVLLLTGNSTTGALQGTVANGISGPYFNAVTSGCTSASGVISGTCSISLSEVLYGAGIPSFTLH